MKKSYIIISLLVIGVVMASYTFKTEAIEINGETAINDVLKKLGDEPPNHTVNQSVKGASFQKGKDLVLNGVTIGPDGKKTSRQSKHFVCTSCHNMEKEDPDLRYADPVARLEYVQEKDLPFLQGSPMYGIIDRRQFYNGDYYKKYGDLVTKARNDLREAIQLCAVVCSQGRALNDWEMESVLMYFWTLGLKMDDLNLTKADWQKIETLNEEGKKEELITFIKSFYLNASPATFEDAPKDRAEGYTEAGVAENGQAIYEHSCLHCHENARYSYFSLDDTKFSYKYLKRTMVKYNRLSLYHVARYGTYSLNGKRAYMPHYPLEKMTNQQLEDLRAYIEMKAE